LAVSQTVKPRAIQSAKAGISAAPWVIRAIFICDENARTVAGCTFIAAEEVRL
jgi:hypothetical protein